MIVNLVAGGLGRCTSGSRAGSGAVPAHRGIGQEHPDLVVSVPRAVSSPSSGIATVTVGGMRIATPRAGPACQRNGP